MIDLDTTSFFVIVGVSAIAALTVLGIGRWIPLPVVVVELILGIIVGPQVLDLAQPDDFIAFFADLGLGMLFFFAGFEIDFERIRGTPLRLAGLGWALSLVLAYGIGGALAGDMRTSTAAALVGAAILSTLCYPLIGLQLRKGRIEEGAEGGLAPVPA